MKVLYEQVIKNPQMANQVSFSKVLNSIAIEVNRRQESDNERSTHCCFVAGTHEDGGYSKKVHQGERTGNWSLHLQAVYDMLPYFAAAGHNLYAKSA